MLEFNDLEAFAFLVGGREVVGNHIFRGANLFFTVDVRLLRHCYDTRGPERLTTAELSLAKKLCTYNIKLMSCGDHAHPPVWRVVYRTKWIAHASSTPCTLAPKSRQVPLRKPSRPRRGSLQSIFSAA